MQTTVISISSISAAFDGSVWAIDSAGTLLSFASVPPIWQPASSGTRLTLVSAGSKDHIWCLDVTGRAYTYANGTLTPVGGAVALSWVSVGADGTVWGISRDGHTLLYDGGNNSWKPQSTPRLARISVGDATHVCALGTDGTAYRLAESTWMPIGTHFKDICVTKEGMAWAVDVEGQVSASLVAIEKAWHRTGWTLQSVTAGSLSNVRGIGPGGDVIDLTNGVPVDVADDHRTPPVPVVIDPQGVPVPSQQVPRFDTEDPFDERQSTHLWIVKRGVRMARDQGATGQAFYDLFQPDDIQGRDAANRFQLGLCMGLYEADFNAMYNNSFGAIPTYASHFYDPDTQLNWLGQATPTALTMGRTLFIDALAAYQANNAILAGYRLGLALHYLTDLGQPQHAANFTNIDWPFTWHGMFEKFVLTSQDGVALSDVYSPVPPGTIETVPDDHFINLAKASKQLYIEHGIGPYPVSAVPTDGILVRALQYRKNAESVLAPMLQNAIEGVSHLVLDWMVRAADAGIPVASENILLGVGDDHNLWTKDTVTASWRVVANSGYVTGVTILPDGRLLGAGADGHLWTKITLNANWVQVPPRDSLLVSAVTTMPDGRILGVSFDHQLMTRDTLTAPWQQVANSGDVVGVTVLPDERLLGVGVDAKLWTKDTLTAPWLEVANSAAVRGVTVMRDGVILGAGIDGKLWTKTSLTADWVEVPNSTSVTAVIEMPSNYL